jgi:hypothetical protein
MLVMGYTHIADILATEDTGSRLDGGFPRSALTRRGATRMDGGCEIRVLGSVADPVSGWSAALHPTGGPEYKALFSASSEPLTTSTLHRDKYYCHASVPRPALILTYAPKLKQVIRYMYLTDRPTESSAVLGNFSYYSGTYYM